MYIQPNLPMQSSLLSSHRYENFIWIKPVLRGHLSYKATLSLSQQWPLITGLTVYTYFLSLKFVKYHWRFLYTNTGADPGFQDRGVHLKKIAPSGGRHENFWDISCEKLIWIYPPVNVYLWIKGIGKLINKFIFKVCFVSMLRLLCI